MTKQTHICIGTLVSIPFITNPLGIIGLIGSIAPDIDIKFKEFGIKHRTITHSFLLLTLSTLLIKKINLDIAYIWFISYLSHLILDSFTKSGVKFLYPYRKTFGLKLFTTGKIFDKLIGYIGVLLIFVVLIDKFIG
jgi:inner membrane protein